MRNCKGYFLLEALIALAVLTIAFGALCPLLYKLHVERYTLKQKREALEWLNNKKMDPTITLTGTLASYEWKDRCIVFVGKNKVTYRECDVKKP
ncbi:hypothetical protein A374_15237 [Fictibacillus macauensis ZFHKF-1]|uniref:Uncharacterized protein n=1 Tax=Fictibacillus macauensis ZFHKF-1 TaxID=1196324 RepID=I8IYF7_9BACL|nr:prepilin-type N-terminal cleavage/methylation domain-containing protein [Fictibacillus macauensis]EIT84491.1 hypothetical protein A374_15237 [Fictibacillus macauensis ZFHKF-1]